MERMVIDQVLIPAIEALPDDPENRKLFGCSGYRGVEAPKIRFTANLDQRNSRFEERFIHEGDIYTVGFEKFWRNEPVKSNRHCFEIDGDIYIFEVEIRCALRGRWCGISGLHKLNALRYLLDRPQEQSMDLKEAVRITVNTFSHMKTNSKEMRAFEMVRANWGCE